MRTWTMVLSASVLAGLMWTTGCGGSDAAEAEPPGPKFPDVASYCNARARVECSQDTIENCAAPTVEACVAKRQMVCAGELPAGKSYRHEEAEACVGSYEAAFVDAIVSTEERLGIANACAALFETEAGVTGAACALDWDCRMSEGYRCVLRADAEAGEMKGVCQVPKSVSAGDSCEAVDSQCEPGLYCDEGAHCVKVGAAGSTCGPTKPCGDDLKCDADDGKCKAKAANGSPCETNDDCFDGLCSGGATRICIGKMILAPGDPVCAEFR